MRDELQKFMGSRDEFVGDFVRRGVIKGSGKKGKTILIENIHSVNGDFVCDHLWICDEKAVRNIVDLEYGDTICFTAKCIPYEKGYKGRKRNISEQDRSRKDYELTYIDKVRKV